MTCCHALKLDGVCFGELDVLSKIPSMGGVALGEILASGLKKEQNDSFT